MYEDMGRDRSRGGIFLPSPHLEMRSLDISHIINTSTDMEKKKKKSPRIQGGRELFCFPGFYVQVVVTESDSRKEMKDLYKYEKE